MKDWTMKMLMMYDVGEIHCQHEGHCEKEDGGDITKIKIVRKKKGDADEMF